MPSRASSSISGPSVPVRQIVVVLYARRSRKSGALAQPVQALHAEPDVTDQAPQLKLSEHGERCSRSLASCCDRLRRPVAIVLSRQVRQ